MHTSRAACGCGSCKFKVVKIHEGSGIQWFRFQTWVLPVVTVAISGLGVRLIAVRSSSGVQFSSGQMPRILNASAFMHRAFCAFTRSLLGFSCFGWGRTLLPAKRFSWWLQLIRGSGVQHKSIELAWVKQNIPWHACKWNHCERSSLAWLWYSELREFSQCLFIFSFGGTKNQLFWKGEVDLQAFKWRGGGGTEGKNVMHWNP